MSSKQRERVFHVKADGWVRASVGTPRPVNLPAIQNAIDKAQAWVMAMEDGRSFYSARMFAPVTWATDGFFNDALMADGPCARSALTDWHTPAAGDRVFVKDHEDKEKNGLYLIPPSGPWTRTTDADTAADFFRAQTNVRVLNGFHWKGTHWRLAGGYGLISTLGVDELPWIGVPMTSRAIVVDDGEPIYVDGLVDVKPGVQLALSGPIIGLETAAVVEDLVVFRTNASAKELLEVVASYTHGGVRVSHSNTDQRNSFAPIRVQYAGTRGSGARNPDAGPGASDRPLHGFSCYGFPTALDDVWTMGGDVNLRVWASDLSIKSLYGLAGGDGAWLRIGNSRIGMLNIDSPGTVPLRIDYSALLHMTAHISTNTTTPGDMILVGDQLQDAWARSRALHLQLITSGQATRVLHLRNCEGPSRIDLVQSATATTAVHVNADVSDRVYVDADLSAGEAPHAFESGVTSGPIMSYRQGGAQRAVQSDGNDVEVVAAA